MDAHNYIVRAHCATYNHSAYITDALNGFVMQQTDFPFVCTIMDDASTDGEQDVIRRYVEDNFYLQDASVAYERDTDYGHVTFAQHKTNKNCFFAVILLKENHYSQRKSKASYLTEWMDTKYIALCEGDDYWTDPLKLQKQVDFMEKHPECCLCCSDARILESGEFVSWKRYETDCMVPPEDIIIGGGLWLQTPTFLYRRATYYDYPDCCKKCHVGDYPLIIWAALNGGVHYLSDVTTVYRHKSEGSWTRRIEALSARDQIKGWRSEVDMLKGLDEWSKGRYKDAFNQRIRDYLWYLIEDYRNDSKLLWEEFSNERRVLSKSQRLIWFEYAYTPWFFSIKRKVRRKLKI